ncbi:hypothetical protein ScPMuIL_009426 [Solemya velum]
MFPLNDCNQYNICIHFIFISSYPPHVVVDRVMDDIINTGIRVVHVQPVPTTTLLPGTGYVLSLASPIEGNMFR